MIKIKLDKEFEELVKISESWPERLNKITGYVVYELADQFRKSLINKIPNSKDFSVYKNSITLGKVEGVQKSTPAYAVYPSIKSTKVKKIDTSKTLILIKIKTGRDKVPGLTALQAYSPWTVDTLPFQPKNSDAKIVYKKTTKAEVKRVSKARKNDKRKWEQELKKANVKINKQTKPADVDINNTILPDVALLALKLEFGIGTKPVNHWRSSQRELSGFFEQKVAKSALIRDALLKESFSGWRSWPPRARQSLSAGDATKFKPFQDKIKIKIG